ncbi:hypothetical protein N0V93_003357 [Gnomoniopsis smithogilvyi]|uniref:Uncharacterized protein n=1 Tax=Gnomoniopsis smithogilvyi TaxID=1191159 RepID=A0A9W8YWH5_9PEZI|nr:hypothetical protein N0V93_003357 [Gnomoniopsis smithogilvyi]
MASYHHRSSANDRTAHKHSKRCRHSHDKHAADDIARNSSQRSRSGPLHQRTNDPDSDSSDEILIKGRISRRIRHGDDKAQRGSIRPSSSSSKEIEVHYIPDTTKSGSSPITSSYQSHSQSSNSSKSAGISAGDITSHLKGIKSWLGRLSDDSHKSSRRSRSRGQHEKRDKHGKKPVSTSKFLAPLAQRWVCYKCGKLRSDTIQQRHPLKEGQKMQPNWCGKCRVHGELHGRSLVFNKQRHYCWGCGIVRSKTYHIENPIDDDERSTPNYCKPCREMSPAFDYNLREASEIGSVASVREKAFCRQMHEADLSDVDEEEDGQSSCAPGKENRNPKFNKTLKPSKSFMLENFSYKVKTNSNSSSEGDVPLSVLKALYLDEERARSTSNGGCRLSGGSYHPSTVESVLDEECKPGLKTTYVTRETLSTVEGADLHENGNSFQVSGNGVPSGPTVILASKQQGGNNDSSTKKKVHWNNRAGQPMSAVGNAPECAYYRGYPSDLSCRSTGPRRSRRDPGDVSTGSPPIQEGESVTGDLRHDTPKRAHVRQPESRGNGFGKDLPAQDIVFNVASYRYDSTQTSHSFPPTPPESFAPMNNHSKSCSAHNGCESPVTPWADSPEVPNFSRPYLSPTKQHSEVSSSFSCLSQGPPEQRAESSHDSEPEFRSGSDTLPSFMPEHNPYQSAARFNDSTQSPDFSSFSAPGEARNSFQGERYGLDVRHGDWPSASCPIYEDYGTSAEDHDGGYFGCYGDSAAFPSSNGYSTFDFSGIGGPSTSNANLGEGIAHKGEKFMRKKKTTQNTPRQHSWHLYDDGEDEEDESHTASCEWRKDGRTTVHRSCGCKVPNEGKTVQILSIREIDSDEELAVSEDNDEASELETVIGDDSNMKSICAA